MDSELKLFHGKDKPDHNYGWALYEKSKQFNRQLNLDECVKRNENFFIGKQWDGVQANGLPTPVFNIIKRVVGFIGATITTDNIKVVATILGNTVGTSGLTHLADVVNDEFEAIIERNSIPSLIREFVRNAEVDGDGCIHTYWDAGMETGQSAKGGIKSEILMNTRVFFGNPNDNNPQNQPWIIIAKREPVRTVRIRAKKSGQENYASIMPDTQPEEMDNAKWTDDKTTVLTMYWKDDNTETVWAFEYTQNCAVREPWDLGIKLYPITWLNWDYVQDCYHGQAMVTGLLPNQVFINKAWSMAMISNMRSAFGQRIFDKTRIDHMDNRVGAAIGVNGPVTGAVDTIDPVPISPQVQMFITAATEQTEQSLGATAVALGDTRPDNTSAIIALQRAAATPSEMTKQNLYRSMEDLFRIYLEFMGEYYGTRDVDVEPTQQMRNAVQFVQQGGFQVDMPDTVPEPFDFKQIKKHPMTLKLDVGASTYYSEIASIQTLDNLLMNGHIDVVDYLERIPDDYVPGRRSLISALKNRRQQAEAAQMAQQMPAQPQMPEQPAQPFPEDGEMIAGIEGRGDNIDVPTGGGYGALQRAINSGNMERVL